MKTVFKFLKALLDMGLVAILLYFLLHYIIFIAINSRTNKEKGSKHYYLEL